MKNLFCASLTSQWFAGLLSGIPWLVDTSLDSHSAPHSVLPECMSVSLRGVMFVETAVILDQESFYFTMA